jgi:hypothetical protein
MAKMPATRPDPQRDAELVFIASMHLDLDTLETRNSDRLDFHDHAVWAVKSALAAAYEAGRTASERRIASARKSEPGRDDE